MSNAKKETTAKPSQQAVSGKEARAAKHAERADTAAKAEEKARAEVVKQNKEAAKIAAGILDKLADVEKDMAKISKVYDKEPRQLRLMKRTLDGTKDAVNRFVRLTK